MEKTIYTLLSSVENQDEVVLITEDKKEANKQYRALRKQFPSQLEFIKLLSETSEFREPLLKISVNLTEHSNETRLNKIDSYYSFDTTINLEDSIKNKYERPEVIIFKRRDNFATAIVIDYSESSAVDKVFKLYELSKKHGRK